MSDTGENFRALLAGTTGITDVVSTRIFQNVVPDTAATPFVWFMRRGVEYLETLGAAESQPYREYFDLECVSTSVDEAIDLSDTVRATINGHSGTMGTGTAAWIDIRDQNDEYMPRNVAADEMVSVASLDVEIINQ